MRKEFANRANEIATSRRRSANPASYTPRANTSHNAQKRRDRSCPASLEQIGPRATTAAWPTAQRRPRAI
eukprot:11165546-Lingulodinium_polyedra.AAC.1